MTHLINNVDVFVNRTGKTDERTPEGVQTISKIIQLFVYLKYQFRSTPEGKEALQKIWKPYGFDLTKRPDLSNVL